jgi:hypothetical protein
MTQRRVGVSSDISSAAPDYLLHLGWVRQVAPTSLLFTDADPGHPLLRRVTRRYYLPVTENLLWIGVIIVRPFVDHWPEVEACGCYWSADTCKWYSSIFVPRQTFMTRFKKLKGLVLLAPMGRQALRNRRRTGSHHYLSSMWVAVMAFRFIKHAHVLRPRKSDSNRTYFPV